MVTPTEPDAEHEDIQYTRHEERPGALTDSFVRRLIEMGATEDVIELVRLRIRQNKDAEAEPSPLR